MSRPLYRGSALRPLETRIQIAMALLWRSGAAAVCVGVGLPWHRWVPLRVGEGLEALERCDCACVAYGMPLCSEGQVWVAVILVDFVLSSTRRHEK